MLLPKQRKPMPNKTKEVQKMTLNESIKTIINDELTKQPRPVKATITHLYSDGYVDIQTDTYGELRHIQTITPHNIGDETILIFLNGEYTERIVI